MMKLFVYILLMMLTLPAFAVSQSYNFVINQDIRQRDSIIKHKNNKQISLAKKASKKSMQNFQPIIEHLKSEQNFGTQSLSKEQEAPRAVVFISFTLPPLLLHQILKEAHHYNIPVVLRGLYRNSFKATAQKMFKLIKANKNLGGVLVDPIWFRQFKIKAVPALVVRDDKTQNYDVIYGNLTLKKALTIIKDQGDAGGIAAQILKDTDGDVA